MERTFEHHVPCGACFYVKSCDERFFRRPGIFRGETAVEEFLDSVMGMANELCNCHICEKRFKDTDKLARDQDHLTGD